MENVSLITGEEYPVEGELQKFYLVASSIFCRVLDGITIGALMTLLMAWFMGMKMLAIFAAIAGVSFIVRLGITAFNSSKMKYSPVDTEYRVSIMENEYNKLKRQLTLVTSQVAELRTAA